MGLSARSAWWQLSDDSDVCPSAYGPSALNLEGVDDSTVAKFPTGTSGSLSDISEVFVHLETVAAEGAPVVEQTARQRLGLDP